MYTQTQQASLLKAFTIIGILVSGAVAYSQWDKRPHVAGWFFSNAVFGIGYLAFPEFRLGAKAQSASLIVSQSTSIPKASGDLLDSITTMGNA